MDSFIDALVARAGAHSPSALRREVLLLILAGLALVTGAYFVQTLPVIAPVLGAGAGLAWFIATFDIWLHLLPEDLKTRLHWRALPVSVRRRRAAWTALAWIAALIFFGHYIAGPAMGSLNIVVAGLIWRTVTLTPDERLALDDLPLGISDLSDLDLPGTPTANTPAE